MAVFVFAHEIKLFCGIICKSMIKSKKSSSKPNKSTSSRSKKQEEVVVEPHTQAPKPFFLITIIAIVLIAAAIILFNNFFNIDKQTENTATQPQNNTAVDVNDLENLKTRVSQLIQVNSSEEPTIATVNDPEILRQNQPVFYKDAEVGDRLLVWSDKAVLYSTKKDKLLSVMLINGEDTEQIQQEVVATTTQDVAESDAVESTIEEEDPSITVLNGTRIAGLAGKMRSELTSKDIPVDKIGDAAIKTYSTTTIIKNSDEEMPATLKTLQQALGAELSEPLEGENRLEGDYVVIVGTDYNQ